MRCVEELQVELVYAFGRQLLEGVSQWQDNQDESQWYWIVVEEATNNHAHEVVEGSHGVHEEGEQLSEHERWTALMPNVAWQRRAPCAGEGAGSARPLHIEASQRKGGGDRDDVPS